MSFLSKLLRPKKVPPIPREVTPAWLPPEPGPSQKISDLTSDIREADKLAAGLSLGDTLFGLDLAQRRIIFATMQRLNPGEIPGLRNAIEAGDIRLTYRYVRMPAYPIFAIKATILDNPGNPFWMEIFPDVKVYVREQKGIFKLLASSGKCQVSFHFYDTHGNAYFRAGYQIGDHDGSSWRADLEDASDYLQSLGGKANFTQGSEQYKAQY